MPAIECRAGVCRDVDCLQGLAGGRVERDQIVANRHPDLLAVIGHAIHLLDAREGPNSRRIVALVRFMMVIR
jgi:hypothetical protein